jgi:hypothetical protein
MSRGGARAVALLLALLPALPARSGAGGLHPPFPDVGPPIILRLEGVLAPSRETAAEHGFAAVSLGFLGEPPGRPRWLGVTSARTVGPDRFLSGREVLNAVAPFTPNLLVAGPDKLVSQVREAPRATAVRVEGLVSRGSRTYYLREVVVHPPRD